jgi:hypothetical protein
LGTAPAAFGKNQKKLESVFLGTVKRIAVNISGTTK